MINIKTFKKSKFIFIFLLSIFTFGIAFSLVSFSPFNLDSSPLPALGGKVRSKRQASPTEVEWNAHMVKIKPLLQKLVGFNKEIIIFKIRGDVGQKMQYSVTNLIKAQNIDAKYSAMSPEAQTELKILHAGGIDRVKLAQIYKNDFLRKMRSTLKMLKAIGITNADIDVHGIKKNHSWIELTKPGNIGKQYVELPRLVKKEFLKLLADKIDNEKLITVYKEKINFVVHRVQVDSAFDLIKPTLRLLALVEITEVGAKLYPIGHLTINLDKKGSELVGLAKNEFIDLLANDITERKLTTIYKNQLNFFLDDIKNVLQIFFDININRVVIDININRVVIDTKSYSIDNLIANLDKEGSELVGSARNEFIDLFINKITIEKLQPIYKLKLESFLKSIKPALQVLKAMGSVEVIIGGKSYSISNLVNVLEISDWETDVAASQELATLYKHSSNSSVVKTELKTAYKLLLEPFLKSIKPALQVLKAMGSSKISIVGVEKPFEIGNLIAVFDMLNWKTNILASQELGALYKHDSDGLVVKQKLQTAHKLFLTQITQNILTFQKNWDEGKVSSYLLWLPVFDIKEVKLSQNKVVSVGALANAIQSMLTAEKFDFTKLEDEDRKQLFDLLNTQGEIREEKTFQDDVWRQIKNHQKWKAVEGPVGELSLQLIKALLLKVQDLGISKVAHPFFPKGYDLSFLQDDESWKEISFKDLLQGMKVAVNGTYVEFYSHLFPNKVVFQVPMKKLSTVFSEITVANIIKVLAKAVSVQEELNIKRILTFQNNRDAGEVFSYLIWLPIFNIEKVKLSQNKVVPVEALALAIKTMLSAEKLDFTELEGKARKQLLTLLNNEGKFRAEKTFQDDVWKQIKNHQKWEAIEGLPGQLVLQSIKTLLLKVQNLGISKVSHPFFPEGYDLSFLKDNPNWEKISFQELLQGMSMKINGTNVEFHSRLFSDKVVFQVPMKELSTVFSEITITNIVVALEKAISDHLQQEKKLESKNQGLIIGLSVAGGFLVLAVLGGFLYWFFKVKK